jgi:hypothetical protein
MHGTGEDDMLAVEALLLKGGGIEASTVAVARAPYDGAFERRLCRRNRFLGEGLGRRGLLRSWREVRKGGEAPLRV